MVSFSSKCEGEDVLDLRVGQNGKTLCSVLDQWRHPILTRLYFCYLTAYGDDDRRR